MTSSPYPELPENRTGRVIKRATDHHHVDPDIAPVTPIRFQQTGTHWGTLLHPYRGTGRYERTHWASLMGTSAIPIQKPPAHGHLPMSVTEQTQTEYHHSRIILLTASDNIE